MAGLHFNVRLGDWHDAGLGVRSHPTQSRENLLHQYPFQIQLQVRTTSGPVFTSEAARGKSHSGDTESSRPESWLKITRQQQKPPVPLQGEFKEL